MVCDASVVIEVCLAGLYLAGAPRCGDSPRSHWPRVSSALRKGEPRLGQAAQYLRAQGLWAEALTLDTPGLLAWAEDACARGRVLSAASPAYPDEWRSVLGASAPPALWVRPSSHLGWPGSAAEFAPRSVPRHFVGVVGSRSLSGADRSFSREIGAEVIRLGHSFVSGGAIGADRGAARGAVSEAARAGLEGCILEILPHGLAAGPRRHGCSALSLCAPHEPFSAARAMERNSLIYALGCATVIVRARFREGGTWHGAVSAWRRHRARLIVQADAACPASRALLALGAQGIRTPAELDTALGAALAAPQIPGLFDRVG
jgi:predicted Rossmann fold nucleotide-binding protein DprA/Smf involved in DNA uptake